ncbi:hypothetical protein [Pseudodesulfovibrio sp. zrk46]|uniref:hypothetical protein n=1 Tax=Pseudodesulfovibrio sp. zrk46 TaxID=2725288 RepID=UPI0014495B14|nr:hypothetical protein [Pseudodesulfovibrio sp. zrk46]QJB55691.1 hypothetical protein HFN16_04435 [Pseudodesulfovibrio sp. zrk46]
MSMECDTRLAMMALRERNHAAAPRRNNSRTRRFSAAAASSVAAMATFALTLFTRSV